MRSRPGRRRPALGAAVLCGALLGNLLDDGASLLGELSGGSPQSIFASRGSLERVLERLAAMRDSALAMPAEQRRAMPGIDWQAWESLPLQAASGPTREWRERLWRLVIELVPATVEEARRHQAHPGG
ncbi:MAG: hypothetical protein PHI64_11360 [Zoogloea sp.]|uniref:hypothetical protein n=1 Tax=Zoogloea sp. TaxID=49181 RepID=UPI002608046E|nr:hypothetical protein [Zoogloea sp.]MDD2989544.1 hypothetical protein [Zoogloea sp.]